MRIFGLKIAPNETNHYNICFADNVSIGVFSRYEQPRE